MIKELLDERIRCGCLMRKGRSAVVNQTITLFVHKLFLLSFFFSTTPLSSSPYMPPPRPSVQEDGGDIIFKVGCNKKKIKGKRFSFNQSTSQTGFLSFCPLLFSSNISLSLSLSSPSPLLFSLSFQYYIQDFKDGIVHLKLTVNCFYIPSFSTLLCFFLYLYCSSSFVFLAFFSSHFSVISRSLPFLLSSFLLFLSLPLSIPYLSLSPSPSRSSLSLSIFPGLVYKLSQLNNYAEEWCGEHVDALRRGSQGSHAGGQPREKERNKEIEGEGDRQREMEIEREGER